jgi:DNA-binding CsgD family transcriptional regulator
MKQKNAGRPNGPVRTPRKQRISQVLPLRKSGLNPEQIATRFGVSVNRVYADIALAATLTKKPLDFLPRPGKHVVSKPKARKLALFTQYAIDVIEGRTTFEKKPPKPKPGFEEKFKALDLALIRNPYSYNTIFASEFDVGTKTVSFHRARLVKAGKIPDVSLSERSKRAKRSLKAKPVLSKSKIDATVEIMRSAIRSKAKSLFQVNKEMFVFLNMKQEDIAQKLERILESRLEAFIPARMPGPKKTKLKRFCEMSISWGSGNVKWTATQKYNAALRTGKIPEKRAAEPVQKFKPGLVKALSDLCSGYRLDANEKAVLFGLAAKIPMADIARRVELSPERIRQIKKALRQLKGIENRLHSIKESLSLKEEVIKW